MATVRRFLSVTAAGKILNPKNGAFSDHRRQRLGHRKWRFTEESVIDPRWGNFITRSFADYHVPANLDIGHMETIFINEEDTIPNKMGIKGIGEIAIVGVAAAVANAIFNATGRRIRQFTDNA